MAEVHGQNNLSQLSTIYDTLITLYLKRVLNLSQNRNKEVWELRASGKTSAEFRCCLSNEID